MKLETKYQEDSALEAVKTFSLQNPEIQIICSSRGSDSLLGVCRDLDFKYYEIIGISIEQAETFFRKIFLMMI